MVMAGTTKANVMGSRLKKLRISAWLKTKKVEKNNQPVTSRKTDITM